jgi:hypothetical protein
VDVQADDDFNYDKQEVERDTDTECAVDLFEVYGMVVVAEAVGVSVAVVVIAVIVVGVIVIVVIVVVVAVVVACRLVEIVFVGAGGWHEDIVV